MTNTSDSQVVVMDEPGAHRFIMLVGGVRAGFVEYDRAAETITFTHTVVNPAFGGRGLGSVLAREVLAAAETAALGVLPACPFIRAFIVGDPQLQHLVPAARWPEFDLDVHPSPHERSPQTGGDPACWASMVCLECGAAPDTEGLQVCPRCGAVAQS